MNQLLPQANIPTIATVIFGAPILAAFVIGSIPVLVPILVLRWISRMSRSVANETVPVALPQAA